ncbi:MULTISPECIES: hypothetical protein [unclassified Aureispira]|uniref:hypothetical protein n=1 Tax=unclassified Aureispira TaxID=2649989 RepID=UPI0006984CBA|nr:MULTISPECIES: hypothetical protein [unclassified Aureispira]WMX13306.1 hypothetical protein QP953_20900 [Aureispira sp. CCB-E]
MKQPIYFIFLLFLFLHSCDLSPQGPSDEALSKMTRSEKWASLEKGMSQENVLRILGKPSSQKVWSGQTTYKFECFTCSATFSEDGELWSWFGPSESL